MYLFYLFFLLPGSVFNRSELSFQRAGRQPACTEKQTHTELSRSSHAMRRKNNEQQPRHLDRSRQQNERNIYRADRSIYRPPACVWSLCLGAHTYPIQPVVFSQGRLERGHRAISAQSPTIIKHRVLFRRGNPPHQALSSRAQIPLLSYSVDSDASRPLSFKQIKPIHVKADCGSAV